MRVYLALQIWDLQKLWAGEWVEIDNDRPIHEPTGTGMTSKKIIVSLGPEDNFETRAVAGGAQIRLLNVPGTEAMQMYDMPAWSFFSSDRVGKIADAPTYLATRVNNCVSLACEINYTQVNQPKESIESLRDFLDRYPTLEALQKIPNVGNASITAMRKVMEESGVPVPSKWK